MVNNIIYFDNNATTKSDTQVIKITCEWMKRINNISTNNILSKPAIELVDQFKGYILDHCKVSSKTHQVVFTSSGSESNCFIINSAAFAYKKKYKKKAHIIASSIEHNASLKCLEKLKDDCIIDYTLVKPTSEGFITPEEIKKHIKNNTCLITVMYANNEIGTINPVKALADLSRNHNIPFHTDAVQIFGKIKPDIKNVTAISASFHKFYSGNGIGLLVLENKFIKENNVTGLISGSQQGNLRGGTESIPLIAGAFKGMMLNFQNRQKKNRHLLELRNYTLQTLNNIIPIAYYSKHEQFMDKDILIILFGPVVTNTEYYLPNTILLSVYVKKYKICNVELKKYLESHNIIVAISSACLTSNKNASHVIQSLNAPDSIKRGVLRISYGDSNTKKEIDKFIKVFIEGINKQIPLSKLLNKPPKKSVKFSKKDEILTKPFSSKRKGAVRSILKK